MRYNIEIHSDESEEAGLILENLSNLVTLGVTFLTGGIEESGALFKLESTEFTYEHGDYVDDEGNLVHVHNDMVLHVTWAGKAEQEDVQIDVGDWMNDHGPLKDAA